MPSKKVLEQKQAYVTQLAEKIKNSNVGIVISYKGINAKDVTELRKQMRENNIDYFVVKNSMLKLASKQAGLDFSNSLVGTTAIALTNEEPVEVAKILTTYAKRLKNSTEFNIKTGFLNGEVIEVATINEIGSLPNKEQLVGQLLSVLVAPIRGLAIALSEIAKNKAQPSEEK